jgi:hypothetical protein
MTTTSTYRIYTQLDGKWKVALSADDDKGSTSPEVGREHWTRPSR